jgi:miniconductance mechanosensitive channel
LLNLTFQEILALPWVHPTIVVVSLILGALFGTLIVRRLLLRGIEMMLKNTNFGRDAELRRHKVIPRLANIVPALFVSYGIGLATGLSEELTAVIENVTRAFIILSLAMAMSGVTAIIDTLYHRRAENRLRPIKGYMQILRIVIYLIASILIISALINKSPVILLSGLGAMAAVLILVFQDTLLSFVASIQISLNDIVRVGDWVEMPDFNADGAVIEIALHTIKIQNWDMTITTIPTRNLVTHSFKNWRGMLDCGGRRIKRSIHIDQNSMHFLQQDEVRKLSNLRLLADYLEEKGAAITDWNSRLDPEMAHDGNKRRLTNLGTFRAYLESYIFQHPQIRGDMTIMVRQLPPTSQGVPLEIYCFTNTTSWTEYEGIQADIFDHIISIIPEFGLALYQEPSSRDFSMLSQRSAPSIEATA